MASNTDIDPYIALRTTLLAVTMLLLGGCMLVGPDYQAVEPKAPERWHAELQGGLVDGRIDTTSLAKWWSVFNDPQLTSLEERALSGNMDLKDAQARIHEARAMRGVEQAGLWPTLTADAALQKSRSSANSGNGTERELYATGFDASWELDLFGGRRRSLEAAQANLEAIQENLHAVLVSMLAEVALNYVEVRSYQARLDASAAGIDTLQTSYELNLSRQQAGLVSELAVQDSLRILESTKAQVPALEISLNAAKNRLAVLIGVTPGSLHQELSQHKPLPGLPVNLAVGIPAETLRHRPDVRRAERYLAVQSARIGMATAELYPKLRLIGTLGLEAISGGELFESASRTWGIGPQIRWNIFNAGAVRQNILIQNVRQEQALITYERTVLHAQEEVENALVAYAKEQLRQAALLRALGAAQRAETLVNEHYLAGLINFDNVRDTQGALILLRDQLAQSNGAISANLIRIYKAFGGGW